MLKKLNTVLNFVITSLGGGLIGYTIFYIQDYARYPGLYDMQSAPWYIRILITGSIVTVVIAVLFFYKADNPEKIKQKITSYLLAF